MKTLLSLVLSLVMALGGGNLPAVPETATVYTLSDIMISTGEDSVFLNPEFVLTVADGAEKLQAQFEVHSGETVLLPMAGEVTPDGLAFRLGQGNSYSLSAEAMDELTGGLEVPAEAMELVDSFAALLSAADELNKPENQMAGNRAVLDAWYAADGVTPEAVQVVVGDQTLDGEKASLNLGFADIFAAVDAMIANGPEAYKAYGNAYLNYLNTLMKLSGSEEQISSISELFTSMAGEEELPAIEFPMEITTAANDELVYMDGTMNFVEDESGLEMTAYVNAKQDAEKLQMLEEVSAHQADEDGNFDMGMLLSLSADKGGSVDLMGDLSIDSKYDYEMQMEDGTSYAYGTSLNGGGNVALSHNVSNSNMVHSDFSLNFQLTEESYDESADYAYTYITNLTMNAQRVDSLGENGGVTSAYALTIGANETDADGEVYGDEVNFALSFLLNKKEVPFADAFADAQLTALPGQYQDAEGNVDPTYQQLTLELMGLMGDLMTLSSEESVMELINTFGEATTSLSADMGLVSGADVATDGEVYGVEDGMMLEEYTEYIYDVTEGVELDLAEAAEAYGAEIPAFTPPEGYSLEYLYASEGYLGIDYGAGETYFSLSITPLYEDFSYQNMILNPDGSLSENEVPQVRVMNNEDGTVAYAELEKNGCNITVFFDSATIETVQAVIAGFGA